MAKTLFKSGKGEIHYGRNAPEGFSAATNDDVLKTIAKIGKMKFWRCHVCGDLHIGMSPPHECPTCSSIESYVEISEKELKGIIGL